MVNARSLSACPFEQECSAGNCRDEFESGFIIPQASELLKKAQGFLAFLPEKTQEGATSVGKSKNLAFLLLSL